MNPTTYRNKLIGSEDERAVSPVIGVILMVAITVILAAVIAAFVLDIGDLDEGAPNAQFEYDYDSSTTTVTVEHTGGDDIPDSEVEVVAVNNGDTDTFGGSSVSAGDRATVDVDSGDTVQVVWESDSGASQIISDYDIPA